MVNKNRDDRVFNKCLQNQQEGHAIFPCISAEDLKPGVCGYFDRDGDWRKIADILNKEEAEAQELDHQENVTIVNPAGKKSVEKWGVRKSEHMKRVEVQGKGGTTQQGVTLSSSVTYKSTKQEGVVLVTRGNIKRAHTDAESEYKFLQWMNKNASKIIKTHPNVQERGVWIITKTTSVPHRAFALVRSSDSEIGFSAAADVANAASIEPSATWWESQKDDMWKDHQNPDGVVLFIGGIKWEPTIIPWHSTGMRPYLVKEKQDLGPGDVLPPVEIVEENEDQSEGVLIRFDPEIVS